MIDVAQLERDLERLREEVDYLIALLEPTLVIGGQPPATTPTTGAKPPQRPTTGRVWHALTPTEAGEAWSALTEWVDWLVGRYQLDDTLPTCWFRHGALVDELDALRAAWVGAYLNPSAQPNEAAQWHILLAGTLARIREWDRYGCGAGTHRDHLPPGDGAAWQARADFVFEDIRHRVPRLRARDTDH